MSYYTAWCEIIGIYNLIKIENKYKRERCGPQNIIQIFSGKSNVQ